MKKLGLFFALLILSGCTSTTSDYYMAVQKTAEMNAMASKARFEALEKIASAGDGQAASAAVMALALTKTPTIAPQPQKSQAIQWASILAAPMTSLGMAYIQADTSKAISQYQAQVDLERIRGNGETQQALYSSFVDMNQATADALGNVDYTPWVDAITTLGTAGLDSAVTLGTAGLNSNVLISGAAIDGLVNLGNAGLDSTLTMGTAGLDSAVTLGTAGLDSATTLGDLGMTSITNLSLAGFQNMSDMDASRNTLFSSIWTDYQSLIQGILDPTISCSGTTAADGTVTINCE